MKTLTILLCLVCVSPVYADTLLEWDRNSETDVDHYTVYYCQVRGCVVTPTSPHSAPLPQVAVGQVPQFTLPLDTEGQAAVTATDTSRNESGLSVSLPFDRRSPVVPANPRTR